MRKLATYALSIATLLLVVIIPLMIMVSAARAADLPSDLTGTYAGSGSLAGWTCEIRAYALQPSGLTTRVLSADCAPPAAARIAGAVAIWDQCPTTDATQPPLVAACPIGTPRDQCPVLTPSTPRLSVVSYSPSTTQCTLGEITVSVGGSPPATMCRTQIIVPTFPYPGCGAPAPVDLLPRPPSVPYYPRLCRQFGLYCGH